MAFSTSKQANEVARCTEEHRQQPLASLSDTFTNNVHPSWGIDKEIIDLAGALAFLRSNILNPPGAAHSDDRVDVKDLLKKLETVLTFGPPSTIVAALCLLSTSKLEDMLKKSFGEHQDFDSRVSLTGVPGLDRAVVCAS